MRWTTALAVGMALVAPAYGAHQASAAPAFTTKYVYYKISGDSPAEVYVSMLKHGPHVNGEKAYAATQMKPSQRGTPELTNNCRISGYQYSAEFTINLPKLADERALSPGALARWRQFSTFVRKHEETHRAIWMGCANEIQARVSALRGRNCGELDKKRQAIMKQVQQACARKNTAFDAAEQKRLAKQPFVRMVLAPLDNPVKVRTTKLTSKSRKKAAALAN